MTDDVDRIGIPYGKEFGGINTQHHVLAMDLRVQEMGKLFQSGQLKEVWN